MSVHVIVLCSPVAWGLQGNVHWHLQPHIYSNPGGRRKNQTGLLNTVGQSDASCSHTGHSPSCTFKFAHFIVFISSFCYYYLIISYYVLLFCLVRRIYLLFRAPPKSQSHGRQPAKSLLRPQYSGCRDTWHTGQAFVFV